MFDLSARCVIETPVGQVPVDIVRVGMTVTLARGGAGVVRWIGRRHFRNLATIDIAAGALGGGMPRRPLRLSPDHAVFVGGLLVPVDLLVNGRSIVRRKPGEADCLHVELDGHDIIIADGASVESLPPMAGRTMFANASVVQLRPAALEQAAEDRFDSAWLCRLRETLLADERAAG
jgi:hypothetical protein